MSAKDELRKERQARLAPFGPGSNLTTESLRTPSSQRVVDRSLLPHIFEHHKSPYHAPLKRGRPGSLCAQLFRRPYCRAGRALYVEHVRAKGFKHESIKAAIEPDGEDLRRMTEPRNATATSRVTAAARTLKSKRAKRLATETLDLKRLEREEKLFHRFEWRWMKYVRDTFDNAMTKFLRDTHRIKEIDVDVVEFDRHPNISFRPGDLVHVSYKHSTGKCEMLEGEVSADQSGCPDGHYFVDVPGLRGARTPPFKKSEILGRFRKGDRVNVCLYPVYLRGKVLEVVNEKFAHYHIEFDDPERNDGTEDQNVHAMRMVWVRSFEGILRRPHAPGVRRHPGCCQLLCLNRCE